MELVMENLTKTIGKAVVINNISAEWKSGKVYGLCGCNGSGKTMLMRLIAGLIIPTKGTISIDGRVIGKDFEFPPSMGILIENPAFLSPHTGLDNLRLLANIKRNVNDLEIRNTLETVGLDPDDKRKLRKYSLGMKQRLGIAAAIMESPELIILDEPTNALDSDGIKIAKNIVQKERERGALIILSCHERQHLVEMADIIYTIEQGQFVDQIINRGNK